MANDTDRIVFINDAPLSCGRSVRSYELEQSRAKSFAAQISRVRKHRRRTKSRPARPIQDYELAQPIPGLSMLWNKPEQQIAFQHWQLVTAPWQSHFHGSPHTAFWNGVVPQLAQEFLPVRYLLVVFELIDLPAFPGESLADRREKQMGYYNASIRSLRSGCWPKICVIVVGLLAHVIELRWTNPETACMHLRSCQKLLEELKRASAKLKASSIFIQDIEDAISHSVPLLRSIRRWCLMRDGARTRATVYGINEMPKPPSMGQSLGEYLVQFKTLMDDLITAYNFDLHLVDAADAVAKFDLWDGAVHWLYQLGEITNIVVTVSIMLYLLGLTLVPFTDNGILAICPDPLVSDHVLKKFKTLLLHSSDPAERADIHMVVRLGLATILRFPHEPRHVVEVESLLLIMKSQNTTSIQCPYYVDRKSEQSPEFIVSAWRCEEIPAPGNRP